MDTTITTGLHDRKADHLLRLRKIEGQVRGIATMVEHDRRCVEVLTQIQAISSALREVALGLLNDQMRQFMMDAAQSDPASGEAKFAELAVAIRRTARA